MRYFIHFFLLILTATCIRVNGQQKALPNGSYSVCFIRGGESNFLITIQDTTYLRTLPHLTVPLSGKLRWLGDNVFQFDFQVQDSASLTNPLEKELYRSFGNNCIELSPPRGDTIPFRTKFVSNLRVSTSEGYYLPTH